MPGQQPTVEAEAEVNAGDPVPRTVAEPGFLLSWGLSALLGRFPSQDDDTQDELHILRGVD